MRKKILILTNNSGGLYCFRKELIAELAKTCQVVASTPFDDHVQELRDLGCCLVQTEFERRGLNPLKDVRLMKSYRRLVREEKPDLVVTYTIKPNIYGSLACKSGTIPYAVNITGLGTAFENSGLLRSAVVRLYRLALKKAKVVFFENAENRTLFIREKMIREDQACLLSGAGVNLDQFDVLPYPENEPFRFLFMGRIMREKGVGELFAAMRRLNSEGKACLLDLLGEYDEDYRQVIDEAEKEGWLKFHGWQPDVRPFIWDCDCFVLPSYHEGMANTNLECAACGRPVITSDIPGCREAVVDGESGLLCEPKDGNSLYQAMKRMMALPVKDREAMGLAGRKHVEACFDKKKVVADTINRIQDWSR